MANSKGKFLLAGLLGAIAGAVGGLLLAPQSGEKTRKDISKMADAILKQIRLGVVGNRTCGPRYIRQCY